MRPSRSRSARSRSRSRPQFGYHVIEVTKKTPATKQTLEQAKTTIEQQLKYQKQSTAWESWLKKAMTAAGVAYAAGFDPATLTASPSPAASAFGLGLAVRTSATRSDAAAMSLTLVYIGAAAGLAPAASLRALSGGGAVFVPAGLEGELRELVAEAADPGFGRLLELDPADGEGLDDLVRRAADGEIGRRARRPRRAAAGARAAAAGRPPAPRPRASRPRRPSSS